MYPDFYAPTLNKKYQSINEYLSRYSDFNNCLVSFKNDVMFTKP